MSSLKTVATQSKYGLVKKGSGGNVPIKRPTLNVFQSEDDLDEDNNHDDNNDEKGLNDIKRVNQLLAAKSSVTKNKEIEKILSKAQEEDQNIFDYDGVYDSMKEATTNSLSSHPLSRSSESNAPKARYINSLMSAAKLREKESDRVYERKLLKERMEGEAEFQDKPKFITTAYKERLKEKQQWEYEDKLQEELDKHTDVRKHGMAGFYSNLLTKNIAIGGDVETNATSTFTTGSSRHERLVAGTDTHTTSKSTSNSTSSSSQSQQSEEARDANRVHDDKKDSTGKRKYGNDFEGQHEQDQDNYDDDDDDDYRAKNIRVEESRLSLSSSSSSSSNSSSGLKKDVILSAKERYLARKQQQQQE